MPIVKTPECMVCHKSEELELNPKEFAAYQRGEKVQDVLPFWTPEERELLITGTHPDCWDSIFGEDDE